MIAFSHIPRTGGTSLRQFIRENLPDGSKHGFVDSLAHFAFMTDADLASLDFLATHCGYGLFRRLPSSVKKVIVLREPVQRVVSLYHHLRRRPPHVSYACAFAHEMTLHDFVMCDNPAVSVFVENTQTWHLAVDKNASFRTDLAGISDQELIATAAGNLDTFDAIGITERLGDLALHLQQQCGWSLDVQLPVINCGPSQRNDPLPPETLSLVRARVSLDSVLYQLASDISRRRASPHTTL